MIQPQDFKSIVILTGAGISAESGLMTFRDANGLWENHRVEDVATPEAFERDPQLVWRFYSMRRIQAAKAQPNKAHHTLVKFKEAHPNLSIHLITQNVDALHHRADPKLALPLIPMHGSLHESRCSKCQGIYFDDMAYFDEKGNYAPAITTLCSVEEKASQNYLHHFPLKYEKFLPLSPCCGKLVRPHIVWFGEVPLEMNKISTLLRRCDLFVSIGTSGQVYPAAQFLMEVKSQGGKVVCLNKEKIPQNSFIDETHLGPATEIVPAFFK